MPVSFSFTIDTGTVGANGLDVGTLKANATYYIFVIFDIPNRTFAGLLSLSKESPSMPASYTKKRYLQQIKTNSSSTLDWNSFFSNIKKF